MTIEDKIAAALEALRAAATNHDRENMARFAITADRAFGVSMANMKRIAKGIGRDHVLAEALWETGWYEARMLASMVDEPDRVTPEQMDRWRADFDNWAIGDTVCFVLFDRSSHAFARVAEWAALKAEQEKRAGFALLACLALHSKAENDGFYLEGLALIEAHAMDGRNFVKKAVNWALRAIGGRKNPALRAAARDTAARLSASADATARWIGKDAARAFAKADKP